MGIGKLILHSSHADSSLTNQETLINFLGEIGLLGQPVDSKKCNFLTGERFLQLISFVGCSTNVCLTPQASNNSEFCNLTITGPFNQPHLVWDKGNRPPRCPACKNHIDDWQGHIDMQAIECTQCGNSAKLEDISWGRHAGYGRIFIEINNIFPGEARPVHGLLANLGKLTGTEWSYFFTSS